MRRLTIFAGLATLALLATPLAAQRPDVTPDWLKREKGNQPKKDGQWGDKGCGYGDPRPECQPGGGKKDGGWGSGGSTGGKKDDWGGSKKGGDDYGRRPPRPDYGDRDRRPDYGDRGRGDRDRYGRDDWRRDRYRGNRHSHGGYWWRWVRELNRYEREDDYDRRRRRSY